jgi:hypothetical protein
MKKILLLFYLVVFMGCSDGGDIKYGGIKGEPKSVMEKKYDVTIKFDDIMKNDIDEAVKYVYDERGFLTNILFYSSSGEVEREILRESGKNGVEIKSETYYTRYGKREKASESELLNINQNKREYSIMSNWLGEKRTDTVVIEILDKNTEKHENSTHITIIKTNKDGKMVENNTTFKENNELTDQNFFKYKNGDNVEWIEKLPMNPDREQIIHTYKYTEYDNKGNWIERIEFEDEKAVHITVREIEY